MSAPADARIYCHRCSAYTSWKQARGKVERCSGCNDRFPCERRCQHLDCARAKGVRADERSPLELVVDGAKRAAMAQLRGLPVSDARALLGEVVTMSGDSGWLNLDYEQQDAVLVRALPKEVPA